MRLTTLGGSAAGIGTRQGCSSYLVRSDTTSIVLDMGPGTLAELRAQIDYRTLDGIVISHLHVDHILDLIELRFTLAYNPIPAERPLPLFLPPDGISTLRRIAQAFESPESGLEWFTGVFDVHEFDPGGLVEIGDLTCSFAETVHFVPCWAIRVIAPGGAGDLFYTADTGPSADLVPAAWGASVVVAEATDRIAPDMPWERRGHLTPDEAATLARDAGAKTLVLTHMWEEKHPAALMDVAGGIFTGTLLRATPGMEVTWTS
jgi:ribonuclease BN (tRNA processing enzyme)